MDMATFERIAWEAEELANSNFSRYKFNVATYAVLGYVVIFAVLIGLLGLIAACIGAAVYSTGLFLLLLKKKIVFLLIPLVWILLKALWVKMESPTGFELTRDRFPRLFEELDGLSRSLKSTKVHQVLLTPELNAAVVQTPRLGVFGWQRNTLFLGLELLLTLSPEQARAVVSHELGHLSGKHSAFNAWIYRIRLTWQRVMNSLHEQGSIGAELMGRFFDWYAPQFAAYSFALARRNEFEADAISAAITSPEDAAAALVNVNVTAPYIDENYWDDYFKQAEKYSQPQHLPWAGLHSFLSKNSADDLDTRLHKALEEKTDYDDTHPSLADRLAALKILPCLPGPSEVTAAQLWLDTEYESIIKQFDDDWCAENAEKWEARHDYVQKSRKTLHEFSQRPVDSLSNDELWERGILTEEFESREQAILALRDYQQRCPDDPDVAFVLGRNLFALESEACLGQLKKAVENRDLAVDACQYAYWYLTNKDRQAEAEKWRADAERIQAENAEILNERQNLTVNDELATPDLDTEDAQEIVSALRSCALVKQAWLAEKLMRHETPFVSYAVAVTCKGLHWNEDAVQQKLAEAMPEANAWVIPKLGNYKPLAKHIIKAGAQVIG